jgi:hypothetical protein
MARPLTGREHIDRALDVAARTQNADELRMALAVVLPLESGLSIEETGQAIGRSRSWVAHARRRFFQEGRPNREPRPGRGGRRRSLLTVEEETVLVRKAVIAHYRKMFRGISVRHELRELLARRIDGGASESAISGILRRVAAVWFPGGNGVWDISRNAGLLVHKWLEEHKRRQGLAPKS